MWRGAPVAHPDFQAGKSEVARIREEMEKLIKTTTTTVRHVIIFGLILVTLVLLSMLGDLRITFIAAITIPFAVLFAFAMMVLTNHSANLISIGAIDFGILVEASMAPMEMR